MASIDTSRKGKKDLNFELNLMPVFDILSVCICFLLMTVVWVQVGALKASQSMGGQAKQAVNPPSVWATLKSGGNVEISLRDVPSSERLNRSSVRSFTLPGKNGQVNWNLMTSTIAQISQQTPSVKTALIMPSEKIAYEEIIQLMDQMKKYGIKDVGLSPL